jgi:hypothetical protein
LVLSITRTWSVAEADKGSPAAASATAPTIQERNLVINTSLLAV